MFVWRWNRVDRKFWKANGKENFFEVCLIRWGERKINSSIQVFSPIAYQKVFSLKWRENWREKFSIIFGRECPCTIASSPTLLLVTLFFFFSFSYYVACLFYFYFFYWAGVASLFFPFFLFFFFFFTWQSLPALFFFFLFRCDFFFF